MSRCLLRPAGRGPRCRARSSAPLCAPTHRVPADAPPGSSASGHRLRAQRHRRLALPGPSNGRARDGCGPCACAAADSPPDDRAPGQTAAANYYGAGGAMDKRLPKVEAAVNGCRDAGAFALIDGLACHPHVVSVLPPRELRARLFICLADLARTQATTSAPRLGGGFLRKRSFSLSTRGPVCRTQPTPCMHAVVRACMCVCVCVCE